MRGPAPRHRCGAALGDGEPAECPAHDVEGVLSIARLANLGSLA